VGRAVREAMPEVAAFIERHVMPDHRLPLMRLIVTLPDDAIEPIDDWLNQPFAPWMVMPADYEFPRALIDTFLGPADTLKMGEACERCGLCVPVYTFGPGDDVKAFPECPACGGSTSVAAYSQSRAAADPTNQAVPTRTETTA
jgi:hypothetical protein